MTANKSMVGAAFILGIITCATTMFMTVYIPYITGGLAIVCVILSRDRSGRLETKARSGLILAIVGLTINTVIITYSVYHVFHDPELFQQFNILFKRMYGVDFSTYFEDYTRTLSELTA